jgi:hypothetical protein
MADNVQEACIIGYVQKTKRKSKAKISRYRHAGDKAESK